MWSTKCLPEDSESGTTLVRLLLKRALWHERGCFWAMGMISGRCSSPAVPAAGKANSAYTAVAKRRTINS